METQLTHIIRSPIIVVGLGTVIAVYAGKLARKGKLPSVIGFMLLGAALGPSLLHILTQELQDQLGFVNDIALGFVALSIGLELSFRSLKRQGKSIIFIILSESIFTAIVVSLALGFLTGNWPFAILFGAIAPASAPANTVAIIHEYRAKRPLTQALYSVVGFDDGLGIVIFGFASAIAVQLLNDAGGGNNSCEHAGASRHAEGRRVHLHRHAAFVHTVLSSGGSAFKTIGTPRTWSHRARIHRRANLRSGRRRVDR